MCVFKMGNEEFEISLLPYYTIKITNPVLYCKAVFTQVKFFNGYQSNYIFKFACVAPLTHNIVLI